MESSTARITARSHRQAMDWSLVLASQGIETVIQQSDEGSHWDLVVAPNDYQRAVEAIRLYRLENRRWHWRQSLFQPGILFDWGSLGWVFLVCMFFWVSNHYPGFHSAGVMDPAQVRQGQWWRLFTAMWLHADASHLASNVVFGFVLLGLAMGRFGTGIGLLGAYLAGAGGNVAVLLLSITGPGSLGASGMVMGSLGLLAAQSFSLDLRTPHAKRYLVTGIIGGIMLFVLLGLSPEADIRAHAGGFVSGVILGIFLSLLPNPGRKTGTNLATGLIFAVLVIWPWYLALRHT